MYYVQPFIWLPWDARSRLYVCLYCANFFYINYKKYRNKNEKHFKKLTKSRDAAAKRADTRGVGISNMRKSIYLLTTTPTSHTHRFHPLLLATPTGHTIHFTHSPQLSSIL